MRERSGPLRQLTWLILIHVSLVPRAAAQRPGPLARIDQYVRAELTRQGIPGLSIAVLRGDTILIARGYGYANLEDHAPATDSTVYEIGSVSKQFTAAAVMMLAGQGRLSLDDPIIRYLPEGSAAWPTVTVRHLLTHTSGISDRVNDTLDWSRDYADSEFVRLIARQPVEFAPGERWNYSSTGYVLLGFIIQRITGAPYGEFLQHEMFGPLHMGTARVISPTRVDRQLANADWVPPSLTTTADRGLSLTVRDLAQWAMALNHGERFPPGGLTASWSPVHLNDGATYPYGFGWHVTQLRGHRRIGHSGTWQGFQATIQRFPDFDLTVIVMSNLLQSGPEAIAFGIAGILEPVLTPPHLLNPKSGGPAPPQPIQQLLAKIASARDTDLVTAGFRRNTSEERRSQIAGWLKQAHGWTFITCDNVRSKGIHRLGAEIEWICYAKAPASEGTFLFTVWYTGSWRTAGFDLYGF